jgi:pimeloyl-ACP methyl ester carboxylesterase
MLTGMPHFTASDGTVLHYRVEGSGSPLVCVPGGPGRSGVYFEALGGLDKHATLIVLDPRGTGGSAMPTDATTLAYPALADDLDELRAHLELDQFDLLGHSAGAMVAEVYAARHAKRLRKLVLVTPSVRLQGVTPDTSSVRNARFAEPWYSDAAQAMAALDGITTIEEAGPLLDRVAPFYYGRWDDRARAHAAGYREQVTLGAQVGYSAGPLARDFDRVGALATLLALGVPTLVLAGALDGGSGVAGAEVVARSITGSELAVLDGCGHYPWVDEPAEFVRILADFLEG